MQLSYMTKILEWVVPGVQWCHQKPVGVFPLLVSFPSAIFSMLAFHLHSYHVMVTRLLQPQASHSHSRQEEGRRAGPASSVPFFQSLSEEFSLHLIIRTKSHVQSGVWKMLRKWLSSFLTSLRGNEQKRRGLGLVVEAARTQWFIHVSCCYYYYSSSLS